MSSLEDKSYPVLLADTIFRLFANCQEKESRFVSEYRISIVEFRCMRILYEHERLTVNQLARQMSLTSSRITRIIDGLVKKQIVTRESGEFDRRIYNLFLTPRGKELTKELIEKYSIIHTEILSNIPQKFHQSIIEGITQLNNAVEKWLANNK